MVTIRVLYYKYWVTTGLIFLKSRRDNLYNFVQFSLCLDNLASREISPFIMENARFRYNYFSAAIFSALAIALSYLAPLLGSAIIQIPPTIKGAIGGPLYSIFFQGFFIPWSNKWVRKNTVT